MASYEFEETVIEFDEQSPLAVCADLVHFVLGKEPGWLYVQPKFFKDIYQAAERELRKAAVEQKGY